MKRLLSLVLCFALAVTMAVAETADTLPKRFVRQLSGGNGARGYIRINASGVAEWLNMLLPFTAADIQVRAIGQKQGDLSADVKDDDDWQVRFFAKDGNDREAGTTWLYGDPNGVYFSSELLPDTLLTLPVEQVNLLYQLFRGEFSELFFAFDPMDMKVPGENGYVPAYHAVAQVLGVPEQEWETNWLPVLEKYFLHLDLWLAGYGDTGFAADESGALKMAASYAIPAEDLKAEAKYLIGQMLYDNELQSLIVPYVTMEERITYLNPQMVYFYEACIDALDLTGDVVLSREMSAMGEVVGTTLAFPLPALPDTLAAPVNTLAQKLFNLSYDDLLAGMNRISMTQTGSERTIVLSGEKRTATLAMTDSAAAENAAKLAGTLTITPNTEGQETAVNAEFTCDFSHRVWQDENYKDRDTTEFAVSFTPIWADDGTEASFQPVSVAWTVDYINNPFQQESPVQVNIDAAFKLPDAEVTAEAVLRVTTQMAMEVLPTKGGQDITTLTEERKQELLNTFIEKTMQTMDSLFDTTPEIAESEAMATAVPPAAE